MSRRRAAGQATRDHHGVTFPLGPLGIVIGIKRWGVVVAIAVRSRVR